MSDTEQEATPQDRERKMQNLSFQERESPFRKLQSSPQPVNQYGYPRPGVQSASPADATGRHYFVQEPNWQEILKYGEFDDIVCGSGFCALAYVDAALELNPHRKILILERGGFWLPSHFQNLPLPFTTLSDSSSETYTWSLTSNTFKSEIGYLHGSYPYFGGRSTFWSAWCPRPQTGLMRDFPGTMIETASKEQFWIDCRKLLHVVKASELHNEEYQILQEYIDKQLKEGVDSGKIQAADYAETASLAVGKTTALSTTVFEKFAVPGPMLSIFERQRNLAQAGLGSPLKIALDVVVKRFDVDPEDPLKRANVLCTSRGDLYFPRKQPNIILATGAIPACTIVQNSIPEQIDRADSIEHRKTKSSDGSGHLELAASYFAGHDPTTSLQYHADVTVIHSPRPETDAEDASRLCPDFFSAPSMNQLVGSKDHIIAGCFMLGEIDEKNPNCWVKPDPSNPDLTTNIRLQIMLSKHEMRLCEIMHTATFQSIEVMAGEQEPGIEYWHDNGDGTGAWKKSKPDITKFLLPGIIHETSTLYMSDDPEDKHASVDSYYKVRGSGNVYATGASIFPTSGSWNPTLTMCGFAQDLAKKLHMQPSTDKTK